MRIPCPHEIRLALCCTTLATNTRQPLLYCRLGQQEPVNWAFIVVAKCLITCHYRATTLSCMHEYPYHVQPIVRQDCKHGSIPAQSLVIPDQFLIRHRATTEHLQANPRSTPAQSRLSRDQAQVNPGSGTGQPQITRPAIARQSLVSHRTIADQSQKFLQPVQVFAMHAST